MLKIFNVKKKCFLCSKISNCAIVSKLIKDNIKCNVYKCQICSLQFLDKKFVNKTITKNFYKKKYKLLYDNSLYQNQNNIYKKIFNYTKSYLINKRILEVGPGSGYFYFYLKKIVKSYDSVELGAGQRKILKKYHNFSPFHSIKQVKKKYDTIILLSVVEHVKNPISFLNQLKKYLNKNGKIIIEVPNVDDPLLSYFNLDYYKKNYYRKVHLNYFNSNTIKKLIQKSNLKIVKQKSILTYSLTNHLSWFYMKRGNKNSFDATNVCFDHTHNNNSKLNELFDYLDKRYKNFFKNNNIGDIEICVCKK